MKLLSTQRRLFLRASLIGSLITTACGAGGISAGSGSAGSSDNSADIPPSAAGATVQGAIDGTQQLSLRIALNLRNEDDLDQRLADLYDPSSAQYKQFLTPDQFASLYLPTAEDVTKVQQALSAAGITPDDMAHGMYLGATGSASAVQAFFRTTLSAYSEADGSTFYAPSASVVLPSDLPISAVHGLYTQKPRVSHYQVNSDTADGALEAASRRRQPTQTTQFSAAAVRSAYSIPAAATGAGQVLALFELDGYYASDISTYVKNNGINAVPLRNVLVNGFNGAVHDTDAEVEVALDIELMNAMAPNAAEIRVYEAGNSGASSIDILNAMANPTGGLSLPTMISTSWGLPEDEESTSSLNAEGKIYKQMAAQGQSFFAASGDSGAYDDGRNLTVDDPASQTYVIGAGGTTLTMSNGAFGTETTWADGGGGISAAHTIPTWQQGVVAATAAGSSTMRNVPDVSLNANPSTGYIVVAGGRSLVVGGTSCAAPLWAAFLGLVNQERAAAGKAATGFLSPTLYSLGQSSQATVFHDVTSGNNGHFNAVKGFDDATGWGSINGTSMLQALTQ